jgi:hypothetical protein
MKENIPKTKKESKVNCFNGFIEVHSYLLVFACAFPLFPHLLRIRVRFMVFTANLNNISVISWRSILLVGDTGVPGENHRPAASQWQTLSHYVYRVHLCWEGFELTMLVVIVTDCISSYKSNYHTITTTNSKGTKS